MSGTSEVLAMIDAAVDDWEVSGDAMRWAPNAPKPEPEMFVCIDGRWLPTQAEVVRWLPLRHPEVVRWTFEPEPLLDLAPWQTTIAAALSVRLELDAFGAALLRFADALVSVRKPARCAGPPPLCIDGRAYHARQRRRRRNRG